jgi:porphobilinogen deaminase
MSTPRRTIYVSSRKSQLAMVQTNEVIGMLQVGRLRLGRGYRVGG